MSWIFKAETWEAWFPGDPAPSITGIMACSKNEASENARQFMAARGISRAWPFYVCKEGSGPPPELLAAKESTDGR